MAKMVDRLATDIQNGDELVILGETMGRGKKNAGLVVEKTLDEDGRVQLLISIDADAKIVTSARPREMDPPEIPFEQLEPPTLTPALEAVPDEDQQWARGEDGEGGAQQIDLGAVEYDGPRMADPGGPHKSGVELP